MSNEFQKATRPSLGKIAEQLARDAANYGKGKPPQAPTLSKQAQEVAKSAASGISPRKTRELEKSATGRKVVGTTPMSWRSLPDNQLNVPGSLDTPSLEREMYNYDLKNFGVATLGYKERIPKGMEARWKARMAYRGKMQAALTKRLGQQESMDRQASAPYMPEDLEEATRGMKDPMVSRLAMGANPMFAAWSAVTGGKNDNPLAMTEYALKTAPTIGTDSDADLALRALSLPANDLVGYGRASAGDARTINELPGWAQVAETIGNVIPQLAASYALGGTEAAPNLTKIGNIIANSALFDIPAYATMAKDMGGIDKAAMAMAQSIGKTFDPSATPAERTQGGIVLAGLGLGAYGKLAKPKVPKQVTPPPKVMRVTPLGEQGPRVATGEMGIMRERSKYRDQAMIDLAPEAKPKATRKPKTEPVPLPKPQRPSQGTGTAKPTTEAPRLVANRVAPEHQPKPQRPSQGAGTAEPVQKPAATQKEPWQMTREEIIDKYRDEITYGSKYDRSIASSVGDLIDSIDKGNALAARHFGAVLKLRAKEWTLEQYEADVAMRNNEHAIADAKATQKAQIESYRKMLDGSTESNYHLRSKINEIANTMASEDPAFARLIDSFNASKSAFESAIAGRKGKRRGTKAYDEQERLIKDAGDKYESAISALDDAKAALRARALAQIKALAQINAEATPKPKPRPSQGTGTGKPTTEAPAHKRTILVNGKEVSVTPEIQVELDRHNARVKLGFLKPEDAKAEGMIHAANMRKLGNAPTYKETVKAEAKAQMIRAGDRITFEGREGVVLSNPAFGKVKVRLGDGLESSVPYDKLQKVAPQPKPHPSQGTGTARPTTEAPRLVANRVAPGEEQSRTKKEIASELKQAAKDLSVIQKEVKSKIAERAPFWQQRAKPGGEVGPNGEHYKGGQFIARFPETIKGAKAKLEKAVESSKGYRQRNNLSDSEVVIAPHGAGTIAIPLANERGYNGPVAWNDSVTRHPATGKLWSEDDLDFYNREIAKWNALVERIDAGEPGFRWLNDRGEGNLVVDTDIHPEHITGSMIGERYILKGVPIPESLMPTAKEALPGIDIERYQALSKQFSDTQPQPRTRSQIASELRQAAKDLVEADLAGGTKGVFVYKMERRGAAPGAVPKGFTKILNSSESGSRYGALVFDDPLDLATIKQYELEPHIGLTEGSVPLDVWEYAHRNEPWFKSYEAIKASADPIVKLAIADASNDANMRTGAAMYRKMFPAQKQRKVGYEIGEILVDKNGSVRRIVGIANGAITTENLLGKDRTTDPSDWVKKTYLLPEDGIAHLSASGKRAPQSLYDAYPWLRDPSPRTKSQIASELKQAAKDLVEADLKDFEEGRTNLGGGMRLSDRQKSALVRIAKLSIELGHKTVEDAVAWAKRSLGDAWTEAQEKVLRANWKKYVDAERKTIAGPVPPIQRAQREAAEAPATQKAPPSNPQKAPAGAEAQANQAFADNLRDKLGMAPISKQGKRLADIVESPRAQEIAADPVAFSAKWQSEPPRPLRDEEVAGLAGGLSRLIEDLDAMQSRHSKLIEDGNLDAAAMLDMDMDNLRDKIATVTMVAHRTGTQWGLGGIARRLAIQNDYSAGGLTYRLTRGTKRKATPAEVKKAESHAKSIADAEAEIDRRVQEAIERRLREMGSAQPRAGRTPKQRIFTEDAYQAAVKRLRAGGVKQSKTRGAAIKISAQDFQDLAVVLGYHIENGVRSLADLRKTASEVFPDADANDVALAAKAAIDEARANRKPPKTKAQTLRTLEAEISDITEPSVLQSAKRLIAEIDAEPGKHDAAFWQSRYNKAVSQLRILNRGKGLGEDILLRGTDAVQDPEVRQARIALERRKADAEKWINALEREAKTEWQKVADAALNILDIPRTLKASLDLSAPGRQGALLIMANPIRARKAFSSQIQAISKRGAENVLDGIQTHKHYDLGMDSKLAIMDVTDSGLFPREEHFVNDWTNKIPGVSHSNRAYSAFLSQLRMDWFSSMIDTLEKNGAPVTRKEAAQIAHFVNVATGRGTLGNLEKAGPTLAKLLFAPKWAMSRIQYAAGQPFWRAGGIKPRMVDGKPVIFANRASKLIAAKYAQTLGGYAITATVLSLLGMKIGSDPNESDFGKAILGDWRYDITGNMGQWLTLGSRTVTGQMDVYRAYAFLRSKLAPIPGLTMDFYANNQKHWYRRDANGDKEPITPPSALWELGMPIGASKVAEQVQKGEPVSEVMKGVVPEFFGIGAAKYRVEQPPRSKSKTSSRPSRPSLPKPPKMPSAPF